jgi:hypothetical protein
MESPNPHAPYLFLVQATFQGDLQGWHRWYDQKHRSDLLSVPGFRALDRYQHLARPDQFLAVWEIDSPDVFSHERYQQVRGWGEWASQIPVDDAGVYQRLADPASWG